MNQYRFGGGPPRWGGKRRSPGVFIGDVGRSLLEHPFALAILLVLPFWLCVVVTLVYFI